jgi:hypothetical protein
MNDTNDALNSYGVLGIAYIYIVKALPKMLCRRKSSDLSLANAVREETPKKTNVIVYWLAKPQIL